ncbi:transporter associated domain-containing protein [Buchnera aphidicola]|uniref:transporter associated domain-containing protein n=1 Tax=Buchnera aphidicola TaxID=9 RepID=UPI0031B85EE9
MDNKTPKKNIKKKGFFSIFTDQILKKKNNHQIELIKSINYAKKNALINNKISKMLKGVIKISKKKIKEIMIPKSQMITLQANYSLTQCLNIILSSQYLKFPVMSSDNNYVEGFLYAKDLLIFLKYKKLFDIKKFLKPLIIVPESKYIDKMLYEFQIHEKKMAIVIDEFGAISGLITIRDILNIIIQDISEQHIKKAKKNIKKIKHNVFSIKSSTPIKEINKIFHTRFQNKTVDTIGGFVMQKFKHLPQPGEKINIQGYEFKISIANYRRIIKLQIKIPKNKQD